VHFETVVIVLFAVATGVALVARWLKVPYTVALVVAGLALGSAQAIEPPHLTKELLYALFLPGLLFEAAFHLDFGKFAQNKLTITALAVPGVAAAITITALLLTPIANGLHFVEGFRFEHGLIVAALLAATDPIAVVGLFKSLGAPKRLAVIVEGESLLNDGTAVVAFTLILAAITGSGITASSAVLDFIRIVGMGLVIGVAFGFTVSKAIQQIDDPMVEITLTVIAAYGSFVVAEQLHFSGVIATVTAGMLCGNYGASTGMAPSTRIAVESFWEYLAFALNSLVFLLIGFSVSTERLLASALPIGVAFLAVTLGRAAVVGSVGGLLRFSKERIPPAWLAVVVWGGLRGGLSMVLVLGLEPGFPHRDLLLTMTYGVVVLSILLQGLTMTPLLRRLGLVGAAESRVEYEVRRGELRVVRAAMEALAQMERDGVVHGDTASAVRAEYDERRRKADDAIRKQQLEASELLDEEEHVARRHLLQVEKKTLLADSLKGLLGSEAHDLLRREVDDRLFRLEAGDDDAVPSAPTSARPVTLEDEGAEGTTNSE
jgi:CPA1 family monovalent cation:H+ antiporter